MAWQIAIVADANTSLHEVHVLLGQMPVWALDTPDRKAALHQLNENSPAIWAPDPAFTLFNGYCPTNPVAEILNLVPTIEEHHYRLSTLRLFGIESSVSLNDSMGQLGYVPVTGTMYPGLGFSKPFDCIADLREINLDGCLWQSADDVYDAFFAAVGAPSWHGRNFDALNDSIATGAINKVEVPYRVTIRNARKMGSDSAAFVKDFSGLIQHLQSNGCPVALVVKQS
jgi:RNAse (barnase) inhibitor barstar